MVDIREIEPGDYVKGMDGQLHEITHVVGGVEKGKPLPKIWEVETTDGLTIDMYHAYAYLKKEEVTNRR